MPYDDTKRAQVFEIFGIPQGGAGFGVSNISTLFGPYGEPYDFSKVVTELNTKLDALTAYSTTRLDTHLSRWTEIGGTSPVVVTKTPAGEGLFADHPAEREDIRRSISNIVGFYAPFGGFSMEQNRNQRSAGIGGGSISR